MQNFKKKILIIFSILILIGTVFFILEKTRYVSIVDSDILWHIKTGDWILQNKKVPKEDVFSWHEGLNWMPHEWLYDVFLSLAYGALGLKAITLIAMILLVLRISFVTVYNVCIKKENIFAYSIFVPILLILEGYTWAVGRPLELTVIILMANLLTFIKKRKNKFYYISFGLSCFLIANLHGGTIQTILAQMLIFIVIDLLYYLKEKNDEHKILAISKLKAVVVGIVLSLVNPNGIGIYSYAFKMLFTKANEATNSIAEWQPINFISITACIIFLIIFCSFAFCKKVRELDKETITKMVIIAFWAVAMLRYCRCTPIFLFVVLLWGYEFVKDFIVFVFDKFNINALFNIIKYIVYVISTIYVLLTMVMGIKWYTFYFKNSGEELLSKGYSYKAIDYLKKHNVKTKIFNDDWGCWLLFNDIPTFVDGRCDPFVNEFSPGNNQFIEVANAKTLDDYMELFKKYDIEYVFISYDKDLITLLEGTGEWEAIIVEERSMLLKRTDIE